MFGLLVVESADRMGLVVGKELDMVLGRVGRTVLDRELDMADSMVSGRG